MQFDAFDRTELEQYAAEVKEKWGNTAAWQEYQQREKAGEAGSPASLMQLFAELGGKRQLDPAAPEVQAIVCRLQQFITDHYYTCTKEILAGLGEMYAADERFRQNIDRAGGQGTAAFAARAIRVFCKA